MNTIYTLSDRDLDARIAHREKQLLKVKPGTWTHGKMLEDLNYYRQQRALPRSQRCQFSEGSL